MPINYTVKDDGAFVHIRAEGRVTTDDVLNVLKAMEKDSRVRSGHVTLYDASRVRSKDLDLEDYNFDTALEMEKQNPEKLVARKLAIVALDLKVVVHAMRYQLLAEEIGEKTAIFNDVHEATLWLKL